MSDLVAQHGGIPAMSATAMAKVRALGEQSMREYPAAPIATRHLLHGGMYARSILVPKGTLLTGVVIKIATVLIVEGVALVYVGTDEPMRIEGYKVFACAAGRSQAFLAHTDLNMTMLFPSAAATVEEAEREFTDEADLLFSRYWPNEVTITGETK